MRRCSSKLWRLLVLHTMFSWCDVMTLWFRCNTVPFDNFVFRNVVLFHLRSSPLVTPMSCQTEVFFPYDCVSLIKCVDDTFLMTPHVKFQRCLDCYALDKNN